MKLASIQKLLKMITTLNQDQKSAFDKIINATNDSRLHSKLFFH